MFQWAKRRVGQPCWTVLPPSVILSSVLLPSVLLLGMISLVAQPVWAGKFNPTLSIGDQAPDFQQLTGVDEKPHALRDWADRELLIIVFTCNTCPTAVDYEDRLIELTRKYSADRKCGVIAINSNKVADDELPGMRKRAELKKFPFTYLRDDDQQIAKAYGASVTPEFFVLDKKRRVVYMGAMDDATDPAAVKVNYVEEAIAASLSGKKPEVTETVARGCLVRYGRQRKKSEQSADTEALKLFDQTILPTLKEHCFECHSATATEIKGDLRLDSREGLRRGGSNGAGVVPGEPEKSFVLKALSYREDDYKMPPRGKLDDELLQAFKKWIEAGAPDSRAK